MHPASTSHRQLDADALAAAGIGEGTVRVAVGIEHLDDLWQDLEQALDQTHGRAFAGGRTAAS